MATCDAFPRVYDAIANGTVQVNELPEWTSVRGRVVWYAYAGPYRDLGKKGWETFMRKVHAAKLKPGGPPGDPYICDPDDHTESDQVKMLTVLGAPIR